jgi:hypothetical protein
METLEGAGRSREMPVTVSPSAVDPSKEMDFEWVRRFVDHGATRLVINAGFQKPAGLATLRDRIQRYQETIIEKLKDVG